MAEFMISPTSEEALQFAIMLSSGMPAEEAIRYFQPEDELDSLAWVKHSLPKWMKSSTVKSAILINQHGKSWQNLSLDEKIRLSVDKNYTEMAYFLYSHNYASLIGADKAKADTCRQALEAKLAGMAGKMDAMNQFFADVTSGKVRLGSPTPPKTGSTPLAS